MCEGLGLDWLSGKKDLAYMKEDLLLSTSSEFTNPILTKKVNNEYVHDGKVSFKRGLRRNFNTSFEIFAYNYSGI